MKKTEITRIIEDAPQAVFAINNWGYHIIDGFTTKKSYTNGSSHSPGAVAVTARPVRVVKDITTQQYHTEIMDSPRKFTLTQVDFCKASTLEEFAEKHAKAEALQEEATARTAKLIKLRDENLPHLQAVLTSLDLKSYTDYRIDKSYNAAKTTIELSATALAALVDLLKVHTTSEDI